MLSHLYPFISGLRRTFWRVAFIIPILALLCIILRPGVQQLQAQVLYGSLTGNVTDVSNAPIPRAKIEAVNMGTRIATRGVTDVRGVYLISDLQPGMYRVTISAQGFATLVQENAQVDANNTRRIDVQLQVATVTQNVVVNAAATPLQTDRADVMTNIASSSVQNLPLGVQRNYESLFKLVPGSTPPSQTNTIGAGSGNPTGAMYMYVNGTPSASYSATIDGTDVPNIWEQQYVAYVPPAEAIQEVNIVTGSFDAELGHAGGSATNVVIKSGTNAFHGSAFEYNTYSQLQARNFFFYGTKNPKDLRNQFGLSLGGPIRKDKLFFFGDWQRYLIRKAGTAYWSVPPQSIRQGNLSSVSTVIYDPTTGNPDGTGRSQMGVAESGTANLIPQNMISSAAAKMAALIPLPNYGSGISSNYFSQTTFTTTSDEVDLKIDYKPTVKSSVFVRYSAQPTTIFDPPALSGAGGAPNVTIQPGHGTSLTQTPALGVTYTFTPHLLLDANIGFSRQRLQAEDTDIGTNFGLSTLNIPGTNGTERYQGGIPIFQISGFSSLGNVEAFNPFYYRDNEYSYNSNLTWIKGSHSLRFGGVFFRYQLNHVQPQLDYGPRGGFTFTGGLTALKGGAAPNSYNAWADFLLGLPQSMGKDYQNLDPGTLRESEWGLYVRDQWQVTRKLSINYGARYEKYPFPTHDHYGASNYDPTTNFAYLGGEGGVPNNAYTDTGLGQLFPRLGIAYRLNEKTVIRTGYGISSDPYAFTYQTLIYPAVISQQIAGANSYSAAGSLVTGLPAVALPNLSLGKFPLPTYLGTQAFPEAFHRGYVESYNFTVQRELGRGFNAQVGYIGDVGIRTISQWNINSDGPGGGSHGTPYYQLYGNPNSIAEVAPFGHSDYNALQTQLTRRVLGGQVNVVYTYSKAIDFTDDTATTLTWSWAPVQSRNKALAGFDRTHNFEFYSVYASPFGRDRHWVTHGVGAKILGGWTFSPILSRYSGTPFTVGSSGTSLNSVGNSQTANQVKPQAAILGGHGPNSPYFDPNAFAPVTTAAFGTAGRNILRGPGVFNIDASLVRDFSLTEHVKLQFRTEAFGLTNTPQFANPGATVSAATFTNGSVSSYNGYDIVTSSAGQRQIRFAMRLSF